MLWTVSERLLMTERFCPNCFEVYEPNVAFCADCGTPLRDGPPPLPPTVEPPRDFVEYAPLGCAATLSEAYVVKAALAAYDIPVRIESELTATLAMGQIPMAAGGFALSIPVDRAPEALQALKTIHDGRAPALEDPDTTEDRFSRNLNRCLRWGMGMCWLFLTAPLALIWALRFWPALIAGRIHGIQKPSLIILTVWALLVSLFLTVVLVYHARDWIFPVIELFG